ncbi:zf-HC2 domain-containing protein [Micromonospora sp. WMMD882]|uniref:zf-HC2 domain-containing protein n=1 Tax=Micromonospora sp. WMMD882 TaxID=3015151 RepID=UPI00248C2BC3|nr:zf-HC2 domain-containing protein [Micromonospora sp. WMMD882]WBB77686.1 zf-HC2 domain-containing protein [Micromonospora sp. WMMD882]
MTVHPTLAQLDRYAAGDPGLDEPALWAIEAHLEDCADCRARLAGSTTTDTRAVLERVAAGLDREIAARPTPAGPGRPWSVLRRRWFVGTLLPWLAMTAGVLACAALLSVLWVGMPALVLLVAPLAPLPGVAVAWNRRADPAWELIAATPAAGLTTLLRRTAAVLAFVVPALALAGAGVGVSLALMLLPCLAFTAAALLLGTLVGVRRAVLGLTAGWTLVVIAPSLAAARTPALLEGGSAPGWALATALLVAVALVRAGGFRKLSHHG